MVITGRRYTETRMGSGAGAYRATVDVETENSPSRWAWILAPDLVINQLSYDVVPASNTARFLIFSAAILLPAATVIIVTKGRLG
jgi:hypothetical protein